MLFSQASAFAVKTCAIQGSCLDCKTRKFPACWCKFLAIAEKQEREVKETQKEENMEELVKRGVLMYFCGLVLLVHMCDQYCY